MKKRFDLLYFCFGIVLAATGVLLWQNCVADAASQSYSETYTVTKWRNLVWTVQGRQINVSVGPAQWNVSGTIGSTTYSEVWNATSWKDNTNVMDAINGQVSFNYSTIYEAGGCFLANTNCVRTSGLYGAAIAATGSDVYAHNASPSSIPEKWGVTGTINTP